MTDIFARLRTALSDRYEIEEELGAGGMATVYLAEDLKHHRKVAVKVVRPELAAVLGPERFLPEIEIAAGLNHSHILPLHDSGEADGFLFYLMPYVEGESLRDRLNRRIYSHTFLDGYRASDLVASSPRVRLPPMRFLFVGPGVCLQLPSDAGSPQLPLLFS